MDSCGTLQQSWENQVWVGTSIIQGNADLSMIRSLTAGMSFSDLPLRDLPIL